MFGLIAHPFSRVKHFLQPLTFLFCLELCKFLLRFHQKPEIACNALFFKRMWRYLARPSVCDQQTRKRGWRALRGMEGRVRAWEVQALALISLTLSLFCVSLSCAQDSDRHSPEARYSAPLRASCWEMLLAFASAFGSLQRRRTAYNLSDTGNWWQCLEWGTNEAKQTLDCDHGSHSYDHAGK